MFTRAIIVPDGLYAIDFDHPIHGDRIKAHACVERHAHPVLRLADGYNLNTVHGLDGSLELAEQALTHAVAAELWVHM